LCGFAHIGRKQLRQTGERTDRTGAHCTTLLSRTRRVPPDTRISLGVRRWGRFSRHEQRRKSAAHRTRRPNGAEVHKRLHRSVSSQKSWHTQEDLNPRTPIGSSSA
jgi:hypothetical protein